MCNIKNDKPIKDVERMMAVGTPLIALDSYDHPHTIARLAEMLKGKERPLIIWNIADGFYPGNDLGRAAISAFDTKKLQAAQQAGPHAAIHVALTMTQGSILIMDNLHWFWDKPQVVQAMLNVREPFKGSKRCVIALVLGAKLPTDLIQSVSYVEDPLPTEELLTEKVQGICRSALGKPMAESEAQEIARELRGTSPFRAEQLTAQSLTRQGIDRDRLRGNARKQINDTPGLCVESTIETFSDVGGLTAMREYMSQYFKGPCRPTVVVRIEELEKAMAGATSGESSGTAQDALGTILTDMEENKWDGIMCYGVSGCGKSLVSKATANEFGARAIRFDINACLNSLVGESGRQIRQAMNVLKAIGGERVLFMASLNKVGSLPPELVRRFSAGAWYFDVPSKEARADIWRIECKHYGVAYDGYDAEFLTGSDIRDIVKQAYKLSCPIAQAVKYCVPLVRRSPDAISQSRKDATGRYLDAHVGGPYCDPANASQNYSRSFETLS